MPQKVSLFSVGGVYTPDFEFVSYKHVIVDRKSKYTVSGGKITSRDEVKKFMKELLKKREFKKATHNSYAYRIQWEDGSVLDGKENDGETGAGNCILRELQREQAVNIIVIVTRYYGWIHLHVDRFKHVIEATKLFLRNDGK